MPDRSPILDLPYIQPSQAQKHVTHNEALRRLDVIVQLKVKGVGNTTPPGAPAEGDVYAVGLGAGGVWSGQDTMLAAFLDGSWFFVAPQVGWRTWDAQAEVLRVWDGNTWASIGGEPESLELLGINATADTINRLSVSAQATLLNHDGAGHQLKLNKFAQADTASLLYQTSFTGHAEMGLAGDDNFSIKVSADGNAWTEALVINSNTGFVSGTAVQNTDLDATVGRLMKVGSFGIGPRALKFDDSDDMNDLRGISGMIGNVSVNSVPANAPDTNAAFVGFSAAVGGTRGAQFVIQATGDNDAFFRADNGSWGDWRKIVHTGNVVGTVSQSAGLPTGSVIERGSNANGEYVRYADGTQWATNGNAPITTAPAPFVGTITKIDGNKLWIGTWY